MKVFSYIWNFLSHKQCFGCHSQEHFFCPQCCENISEYTAYCYVCKKPSSQFKVHTSCNNSFYLKQIIVLTRYRQQAIKKLLRHAKYYSKYPAYSDLIFSHKDFFEKHVSKENIVFIPVPMHFLRKWKRGYNHTDKIAKSLGSMLHTPVYNTYIKKHRHSKQQSHLSLAERQKNLKNSYKLTKNISKLAKNSTIYLIDDIISTGSTLNEIAKLLNEAGFQDVRAIVLASD